jgi:hypothetical protein
MRKFIVAFLGIAIMLLPKLTMAQLDPGCSPDEPCPVDSNVYLLLGAVVLFAGLAALKKRRQLN